MDVRKAMIDAINTDICIRQSVSGALDEAIDIINNHMNILTSARGEPMPKTIEHYQANALRDQELILEQKEEISKLKQTVNNLRQRYVQGEK